MGGFTVNPIYINRLFIYIKENAQKLYIYPLKKETRAKSSRQKEPRLWNVVDVGNIFSRSK
jgi:hypothetical protein